MTLSRTKLLTAAVALSLSTNLYAPPGGGGGGGGGSSPIALSCNTDSPDPANINELVPQGTHPGGIKFIEVIVLEDVADITGWQLCTSDKGKSPDCFSFGSGDFILGDHDDGNDDSGVTSVTATQYFSSEQTLSSNEWEIALLDGSGDVLDYVHYCNSGCTPAYWDVPASCSTGFDGTKDNWGRNPDGTGDFEKDIEPTPGTNNNGGGGEATLAYYQISHSSPVLTCEAADITITAIDSDGNPMNPSSDTTINLSAELVSGSSATNTFYPSSYTFSGSESSTTVQFVRTEPGILDIDVTDGSVTDQDGLATDPDIEFTDVAFKFYADGVADVIGTQIAGKENTVAPGNQEITLRAIESDPDTGECTVLKPASGFEVNFGYECKNPTSCSSGQLLSVDGTSVSGVSNGTSPQYDPVTIDFDASGTATLTLNYQDVGQIQVYASADVSVSGGTGETVTVTGSSNPFVVRPFALRMVDIEDSFGNPNPGGDETAGNGFVSAGSDFFVTIESYLYQAADDDADNDGSPDADAILTDNGLTPNFSQQIDLSINAFSPLGADSLPGDLEGDAPIQATAFSEGAATATLRYLEVGSITLLAGPVDYLSSGEMLSIPTEKIGRFYPDYFELSGVELETTCPLIGSTALIYMQQPFASFKYQIEAKAVGGTTTEKYDMVYYPTDEVKISAEAGDDGVDLSGRMSSSSISGWVGGVIDRVSSPILDLTFNRNGGAGGFEDGPYEDVRLGFYIDETNGLGDGNNFESGSLNFDPSVAGSCGASCTGIQIGSNSYDVYYGRLYIQSAHGPENQDLPVPFLVQYWNGSSFVTAINDSCSQIPLSNITFDGNSIDTAGNRTVTVGAGTSTGTLGISGVNAQPALGDFTLEFSAPGEGNTGYFNLGISNVPAWLRYDWDQDGAADDINMPDALITFGRARGNDRMIFWQERYQ